MEMILPYFLLAWVILLLLYLLYKSIKIQKAYDEETENTLINANVMTSSDSAYCSAMLSAIYTELRRQGR